VAVAAVVAAAVVVVGVAARLSVQVSAEWSQRRPLLLLLAPLLLRPSPSLLLLLAPLLLRPSPSLPLLLAPSLLRPSPSGLPQLS
jgi:hypothetical protein